MTPLGQKFFENLKHKAPNSIGLIDTTTAVHQHLSYADIVEISCKVASALQSSGLKKGDVVCIISKSNWQFVVTVLAGLYIGTPLYLVGIDGTKRELKYLFEQCPPKWVFCSIEYLENIQEVRAGFTFGLTLFDGTMPNVSSFEDFIADTPHWGSFTPDGTITTDDIAAIYLTSGTTGHQKCMPRSHSAVDFSLSLFEPFNITVTLQSVELSFTIGFDLGLSALYRSSLLVLTDFTGEAFNKNVSDFKIQRLISVPTLLIEMAKSPLNENHDFSHLEDIIFTGSALTSEATASLVERFKPKYIRTIYGMSEVHLITANPTTSLRKNSVGVALHPDIIIQVRDKTGQKLGPHQVGELYIKSPGMANSYLNNPEATQQAFINGFFKTADLGYYDEDHYIYVTDRIKNVFKCLDYLVSPTEIENAIVENFDIKEVAVVGLPDSEKIGKAAAFVVKKEDTELSQTQILEFVKDNFTYYKWLYGGVHFVDHIPRNNRGKIVKRVLVESLAH